MSNENKPMTAEEICQDAGLRKALGVGGTEELRKMIEEYADYKVAQQVAAALAEKKEPETFSDAQIKKEWSEWNFCWDNTERDPSTFDAFKSGIRLVENQTAALLEEIEMWKSALEGKEQEKQEYKDKVELAVCEIQKLREELEGARKMVEWARFIMPFHGAAEYEPFHIEAEKYLSGNEPVIASPEDMVRLREELEVVKKERDVFSKGFEAAREAITKACEQRDEAVKLLRDYRRADSNIAYKERFQMDSETDSFLSRLSSGETKPVSPWISVEERLPEEGNCLVAYKFGVAESKFVFGKFIFYRGDFTEIPYVTHWMPLPAPPESLNNKK